MNAGADHIDGNAIDFKQEWTWYWIASLYVECGEW